MIRMKFTYLFIFLLIASALNSRTMALADTVPRGSTDSPNAQVWLSVGPNRYLVPDNIFVYRDSGAPHLSIYYIKSTRTFDASLSCKNPLEADLGKMLCITFGINLPGLSQYNRYINSTIPAKNRSSYYDKFGFNVTFSRINRSIRHFSAKKNGKFLYFYCILPSANPSIISTDRVGICDDTFVLSDGNEVRFNFPYSLRGDANFLESAINRILNTYREKDGPK